MATIEINSNNFDSLMQEHSKKLIIIDFWADWCAPCKMLAPTLESLSEKHQNAVTIFKLNTEDNMQLAQNYQITSIPCCIVFKDGKEVHRIIGHKSEDAFEAEMSQFL